MTSVAQNKSTAVLQGAARAVPAVQASQYTLWQMLGIWAAAAIPMGLPLWVILPAR